jgi:hypothetical protein
VTQSQYQRQYYELRKTRGCFYCGKPKPQKATRCHQCARDHAARAKELYDIKQGANMKRESKAPSGAQDKITPDKPKRGRGDRGKGKITSNRDAEEKLNKAAVARGLGMTRKTHSHKTARAVFLRVNQLSEKFVSPFGLGLGEL